MCVVTPSYHYFLPSCVHSKKQAKLFSLKNVHGEVVNTTFTKSQPLSAGLLNILCKEIRRKHKALLLHAKVGSLAQEKAFVDV